LEDAVTVLDASTSSSRARLKSARFQRRVQQHINGHRGHRDDPPYRIRNLLSAGQEHITDQQKTRPEPAFAADDRHLEVEVAWQCAQQLRSVYDQSRNADGRGIAEKVLASFTP